MISTILITGLILVLIIIEIKISSVWIRVVIILPLLLSGIIFTNQLSNTSEYTATSNTYIRGIQKITTELYDLSSSEQHGKLHAKLELLERELSISLKDLDHFVHLINKLQFVEPYPEHDTLEKTSSSSQSK